MEEYLAPLDLLNRSIYEKTANRFKIGTIQEKQTFELILNQRIFLICHVI